MFRLKFKIKANLVENPQTTQNELNFNRPFSYLKVDKFFKRLISFFIGMIIQINKINQRLKVDFTARFTGLNEFP